MIGTYALSSGYYDAYYGQAQKVRTLIARDFAAAFEQADVLVSPTSPFVAFGIGERVDDPMAMYVNDLCTLPASLAGTPAISVPCGLSEGLPVGLQIMAPALADDRCYRVGGRVRGGLRRRQRSAARAELVRRCCRMTAYDDVLARYEPVIGLETHVELGTVSKMFCGCSTEFGAEPNTHTCPVCLGLPGALPVANETAIESTIRIGLALNCSIATWCRFARKNYFYPDMPKNFQTSQYDEPLCVDGYLDVEVDGETVPGRHRAGAPRGGHRQEHPRRCGAGASTAPTTRSSTSTGPASRWSRSSPSRCPAPARCAPEVARAYVTELRDILRTLGVSDVRMEQGSLRCDVNTSLNLPGCAEWGTRTETKNVNSLRSVERAVRSEIMRQAELLDAGRADQAGDAALLRDDRRHPPRPQQGRGDRLPLLPRARPRADRAGPGLGRDAARRACRSCPPRGARA